jgi:hypothetical protein
MSIKDNQILRSTISFCFSLLGGIVGLFGFMLMKGIPVLVSLWILFGLEDTIKSETWRWVIAIALFWIILGLVSWRIAMYVCGLGVKLMDYGKDFKKSYIKLYGASFPEPTFEQFGMKPEDYYAYNNRFQFDLSKMILMFGTLFGIMYLRSRQIPERGLIPGLKIAIPAAIAALGMHLLLTFINHQLSKKWPQYGRVQAYNKAEKIYRKIEEETREKRFKTVAQ